VQAASSALTALRAIGTPSATTKMRNMLENLRGMLRDGVGTTGLILMPTYLRLLRVMTMRRHLNKKLLSWKQ
jgi:hypothetical protein